MLTWIGPILSSFLSGFTTTFVELYREWQRRNDIEELSKLKEMDRIRQTYVGEQRRLRSLGYDKILSEIHKEIGPDGVASSRHLLDRVWTLPTKSS